jgi:glycosyltransferase involved in cell wall biosynthesis
MLVAIPSKGRAGAVKTLKVLPSASLYIPESEERSYRGIYPDADIVTVPETVRGITNTRNWVLENADDRYVVFVDDDVVGVGYWAIGIETKKRILLTQDELHQDWTRLFHVTDDLGYHLWGAETTGDYIAVHPHRPFIWHAYVTASCMGVVNDGIRFDPEYPVKEDYELCLRCIKEDGGIVGARFLFWKNEHWAAKGGCGDYRTQGMEDEVIHKLMDTYPGYIKKITKGGSQYSIRIDF